MGTPNDSLSVLQSVAAEKNQTAAPAQSSPQDSLSVLQDVAGAKPINMVGPKGEKVQVPQNQVADMRQKNFAVTPDTPDTQKMLNKQGQILYALPSEVDSLEQSKNAVRINPDGSLLVPPGQSQWSQEYRDRHDIYFQAHQNPDVQKALATSDKTQNVAGNVMLGFGVAGNAVVAGAAAGPPAAQFARQVGTEVVKHYASKTAAQVTADLLVKGAAAVGLGFLGKLGWSLKH